MRTREPGRRGLKNQAPVKSPPLRKWMVVILPVLCILAPEARGWERDLAPCGRFHEKIQTERATDVRDRATIDKAAAERLDFLAEIRGLKPGAPVPVEFRDRDWFLSYFMLQLENKYPSESREGFTKAMGWLGVLSDDPDWMRNQAVAWSSEVWGLFDADRNRLVLSDEIPDSKLDSVMDHELVHVLQERNFPNASRPTQDVTDSSVSLDCLREGEAVILSAMMGARRGDREDKERSEDYARWWRVQRAIENGRRQAVGCPEQLTAFSDFSYHQGAIYVQSLLKQGGWKEVDEAWKYPPQSTYEILHPDLPRPPTGIDRDAILRPFRDGSVRWSGVLGAFGWMQVLGPFVGESSAGEAMEGWKGDRVVYWERRAHQPGALMAHTLWRDAGTARRFYSLLSEMQAQRWKGPAPTRTADRFRSGPAENSFGYAEARVRGNEVWWVAGLDAPGTTEAMDSLLKNVSR